MEWNGHNVILSYIIAVVGSYCTTQLMDQWRHSPSDREKKKMVLWSSIAFGGCCVWGMHFTGMDGLLLHQPSGEKARISYNGFLLVLSFIETVLANGLGLAIAATDPFFQQVQEEARKTMLMSDLKSKKMQFLVNRKKGSSLIKKTALFSRLERIFAGSFVTAIGINAMNYLGLVAIRTVYIVEIDYGLFALCAFIGLFTTSFCFWTIFRAITFSKAVRKMQFFTANLMGLAICLNFYSTIMFSVSFTYSGVNPEEAFLLNGDRGTAIIASHGSLIICYILSTGVVTEHSKYNLSSSVSASYERTGDSDMPHAQNERASKTFKDLRTVTPICEDEAMEST